MEILFKNTSEASSELKELLGFIDVDLKFSNIKADVISATKELIKIIGKDVYTEAVRQYKLAEADQAKDEEFIRVVRYPIAVGAYIMYAPNNDISHTNNGRKMMADDSEKTPFEWMLDRNDAALERKYYRCLDELIDFLDDYEVSEEGAEGNTLGDLWRASEAFKKTQRLFVRTIDDFDTYFPISSRLLLIKLSPGLEKCEKFEIKPRLAVRYKELKEKLYSSSELEESDVELVQLIQAACVPYAMAWAMPRLSVNLYPEGVLQHYTSDRATTKGRKPTLNMETQEAAQAFEHDYELALGRLDSFLLPEVTEAPDDIADEDLFPDIDYDDKHFSA
ncbi:hypothetical protein SAMN05216480_10545 [Pustulibacterium marinum]|uniref:Uncharacterized protein n=1 Tax=Pustulibacterium marinum TaxID=1224947 RepID=A0A1I7GL20_9FLAO|nr:DUF6712 family protein [Pustulibacterium marinum]SFU49114.1 hypothetical protein SAMN05216480_10545 [Pustulibacterium marinum]